MRRLLLLFALLPSAAVGAEITLLADGDVGAWEYQAFDNIKETDYRQQRDETLQKTVLSADSRRGASGYILRQELNLNDSPWLHFLWRVDHAGGEPAEKTRAGDDFAWRLYFIGRSGIRYRTLDFVYAQTADEGEIWKSPYSGMFAGDIRVYALAAGGKTGVWRTSSVNIAKVWKELFGDDDKVGAVGIMSDGDSAGVDMRASYGVLVLSDSPTPPFAAD